MNIRSIDLQVLIPRATEVSKVQQTIDHQSALSQQQTATQMQQISAARQQQVQRRPEGTGGKVEPDAEDGGRQRQGSDRRKGGQKRAETDPDDSPDPLRGHNIDIKT